MRRNEFSSLPFDYTLKEQKQILDYCQSDTEILRQLFIKQVLDIETKLDLKTEEDFERELWQIQNRGYAVGCVSPVERNGLPVDTKLISMFNEAWPKVKDNLIRKINKDIDVFTDDLVFNHKKFDELIIRNKLTHRWQRINSGHFTTNKKVIKNHLDNEDIKKFNEIRTCQNMTKLTAYSPGQDGRVRTSINMFGTVTGRASPSSARYPFSASKWARNFIKPSYGSYLVYIDYTSQEPGIMGYLSKDENLIKAYHSGDIYIHKAKLFNYLPENAVRDKTNQDRADLRTLLTAIYLANSSDQGPISVSTS